jgi:hypothetical protein
MQAMAMIRQQAAYLGRYCIGRFGPTFSSRAARSDLGDVQVVCLFVGHGRSGSSLVGALLNAHHNIVISNELNVLRYLAAGLTTEQLFHLIRFDAARSARLGSQGGGGYRYAVDGQWQGRYEKLVVLGDRKAGGTAKLILENPGILDLLRRRVRAEIRFVNVLRNPFDNITTTVRKTRQQPGESPAQHVMRLADDYFWRFRAIDEIRTTFGDEALYHLHGEDLLSDPAKEIRGLCRFLHVDCPAAYIEACSAILFKKPQQTRHFVEWDDALMDRVQRGIAEQPLLSSHGYTFTAEPE